MTHDQSEPVMAAAPSKRRFDSSPEFTETKKSRHDSSSDTDKVRMNPSQIEAEFRVLQSLIPQIANRQQLSEVKPQTNWHVAYQ